MRIKIVPLVAVLFSAVSLVAGPAASAVTVYFSSPTSSTVSTSFSLKANATSGYPITGWAVYVDSNKVWSTPGPTSYISITVNVSSGWHNLHVTAWDSSGASGYKEMSIDASGSTSSSSLPSVPSTATVFYSLDDSSFNSCSAGCAGGQTTTNYWQAGWQTSPSLDGSSREFFNGGNAWANVLWYKEFGGYSWATHFLWDFWVQFNSGIWDLHSAEFDAFQANSGVELMMGSQCNFGNGVWDTWNESGGYWSATSIPCHRFQAGTWHHIQWYMTRPAWNEYTYRTLVVDGVAYSVNRTYYGKYTGWSNKVGIQYQLDLGPNGVDNKIWIDKVKLSIW